MGGIGADRTQRMRPGEMMLAEMARALNAGLGLAGNGGVSASAERRQGVSEAAGDAHVVFPPVVDATTNLPPEGTFERFLANLQSDLRTILSDESPIGSSDSAASVPPASSTADAERQETTVSAAQHRDEHDNHEDELPSLVTDTQSVADSDNDEFQDADENVSHEATAGETSTTPPRTPTPIPPAPGLVPSQDSSATEDAAAARRRDRPVINLWRIHRFDPIPAVHAQEHATRPAAAGGAPNGPLFSGLPDVGGVPVVPLPTPATSETPTVTPGPSSAAPSENASRAAPNVVVPVIVVGLQSVDVMEHDEPEDDGAHGHLPVGPGTPATDAGLQDSPFGTGRPTTPRGRTWQSRAATALRTWRPGMRGSRTRRNTEGTGSRTFLIYVIGGMSRVILSVETVMLTGMYKDTTHRTTIWSLVRTT
jgi:hypothetical protein